MRSAAIRVVGLLMIHYSVKDVAFSVRELWLWNKSSSKETFARYRSMQCRV